MALRTPGHGVPRLGAKLWTPTWEGIPSTLTHARGSSRYVRRVMVGSMLWLIIPELCLFRNGIHKTQEYLQMNCNKL